jgi:serine/threonine-protein kinase
MSGEGRVGTLFAGRYEIESRAGHGGMGTVYRAWDRRLSRWVAIKFPLTELADDPVFRRRFLREALMAATIEHRNIVPIYDAGDEEGVLYLTMRWVDGTDLNRLLRETGSLDPERTLSIIAQVGSALDAAQARSLTHRDVKPANILLTPRASAEDLDQVYLADFGLTKRSSSQTVVTSPGYVIGSLHYLAPEQIEGSEVDGRTDLYSLGCVLYQCLTGLPPFERDSDIAVIWAHVNASRPAVTAKRHDLPPEIDAVIGKALAKSKDDRYGRCSEMVAAARLALGSAPPGGRTTSGPTAAVPPRPAIPPLSGERTPAPTSTPAPAASAPAGVAEAGRKREAGAAAPLTPPSVPANGRGPRIAAVVVSIGVLLGVVAGGAFLISRVMAPSSPPNGAVGPVPPQHRVTFDFTGGAQTWTVPAGVTSATFHVYGAQGGGTSAPSVGGLGGSAFATLNVNPGDALVITVGGQGRSVAVCDQNTPAGAGGFNGGGAGGGDPCAGAGGGGASDVRTGPDLDQRILVAGGGGGATFTIAGDGGAGGDVSGGSGRSGAGRNATGGAPGTQATGSGSGQLGAGSIGVNGDTTVPVGHHGGGGGGGGYLGGAGGGQDTGGGGGSGKGPSGTTFDIGVREGHGMVEISY